MAVPKTRGALLLGLWASLTLWQSAQGKPTIHGKNPEECILIIEGEKYNDVLIYNGTWFNGRPAYISVNEDGNLGDRTLYYSKLDKWNYAYVGKDDNADPYDRLGYINSGWDKKCPQEGQHLLQLDKGGEGSEIGTIHRARWPSYDMCRRQRGAIYGYTDRKLVAKEGIQSLTECARLVLRQEREANGAQWNSEEHCCYAVFGRELDVRADKVVNWEYLPRRGHPISMETMKRVYDADNYRFSCIFTAHPKPGKVLESAAEPPWVEDLGEADNEQMCLQKAVPKLKRVKAVVFDTESMQCTAMMYAGDLVFNREYSQEVFHTSAGALSRKPLEP